MKIVLVVAGPLFIALELKLRPPLHRIPRAGHPVTHTSSAGTPPIASKAPTWPPIQSASPLRPGRLRVGEARCEPTRPRLSRMQRIASKGPLRQISSLRDHPIPASRADATRADEAQPTDRRTMMDGFLLHQHVRGSICIT
jgi:hypothetical protein